MKYFMFKQFFLVKNISQHLQFFCISQLISSKTCMTYLLLWLVTSMIFGSTCFSFMLFIRYTSFRWGQSIVQHDYCQNWTKRWKWHEIRQKDKKMKDSHKAQLPELQNDMANYTVVWNGKKYWRGTITWNNLFISPRPFKPTNNQKAREQLTKH